jgi:hypothetical protein
MLFIDKFCLFDVDPAFGCWHHVEVGCVADFSEDALPLSLYCESLKSVNSCLLQGLCMTLEDRCCIMLIHCQPRTTYCFLYQGLETSVLKNLQHLWPVLLFLLKLKMLLGLLVFSVVKYTDRKAICQFTYALSVARNHSSSVQYAKAGLLV